MNLTWKPIDTAPQKVEVLLFNEHSETVFIGYLTSFGIWRYVADGAGSNLWFDPTHWMPLPNKIRIEEKSDMVDIKAPPNIEKESVLCLLDEGLVDGTLYVSGYGDDACITFRDHYGNSYHPKSELDKHTCEFISCWRYSPPTWVKDMESK